MGTRDKRRSEVWNWLLQRVTGVFLAYALAVHLWAVHVVNQDQLTWATITARLRDGNAWTIYYALFVPAVVYHACNGLWGIALDYSPAPRLRRWIGLGLWGGATVLLIYGYFGLRPLLGGA
jgi:succinate dehydrogenase hydrophobic anchor subunit